MTCSNFAEIGARIGAIDWAMHAFQSAGVTAHAESYTMPRTWVEGATRLDILGNGAFPVSLVSEGWSAATPASGIEADVVHIGDGTPADFERAGPRTSGTTQ